jgi:hypothetical protein
MDRVGPVFPSVREGAISWFWGAEKDQPFRNFVQANGWLNRHVYASYHSPPPPSGPWKVTPGPRTYHVLEDGREVEVHYATEDSRGVYITTAAPAGHHFALRIVHGEKRRKRVGKRHRLPNEPHQDV